MARVMIICPETGKYVDVGIRTEATSFASMTFVNNSTTCPHCGKTHTWSSKDARLIEDQTPPA